MPNYASIAALASDLSDEAPFTGAFVTRVARSSVAGGVEFALAQAKEPVTIIGFGDSTGNNSTDWYDQMVTWLGTQVPAYTVQIPHWNDTNQGYDSPTVVQTGTAGGAYIVGTGATPFSSYISTPDSAGLALSGDFGVRFKARKTTLDTAGEQVIASQFGSAGNRAWRLYMTTGNLYLGYSADGTTLGEALVASKAQMQGINVGDGTDFVIQIEFDVTNGANVNVQASYSTDEGLTFTNFGTAYTAGAAIANVFNSTAPIEVGSRGTGGQPWVGRIYWFELYSGIGSSRSMVLRFDPALYVTGTTMTDMHGRTWTTTGTDFSYTKGAPLLLAYNAFTAGQALSYSADDTRLAKQMPTDPHLAFIGYGHNDSAGWSSAWASFADEILTASPYMSIVGVLQNPQTAPRTDAQILAQDRKMREVAQVCAQRGYGVVDAYNALGADTATYISADGVHPTQAGYDLWATTAEGLFATL